MREEAGVSHELRILLRMGELLEQHPAGLRGDSVREFMARSLLRIRGKDGKLLPLVANRAQQEFERRAGKKNIELKTHMRWIVGNGNEGKMQELEERVQKQEAALQRLGGMGAAVARLLVLVQIGTELLRVVRH